jgi:hypothetical protein
MIQQILEPFDWVVQMPIEDQCRYSIGLSFVGFCIAAVLREMCKDKHIRFVARALGAAAFFAVAAFAVHATKLVDRLEDVVASQPIKAQQVTEQYLSVTHLQTPLGFNINVETDNERRSSPVRDLSGCSRRSGTRVTVASGGSGRTPFESHRSRPTGNRPDGHFAAVLTRKPDESIDPDDGPEQF